MQNLGDAFTYPFRDPEWPTKILLGGLFVMLSVFLIGIPVVYGYYIELLRRVRRGEEHPLPEWTDVAVKFITGIKYLGTLLVYYLPVFLLAIPLLVLLFVAALGGEEPSALMGSGVVFAMVAFLFIPYSLLMALLTPFIALTFAERESMADSLRVGLVFSRFGRQWTNALLVVLLAVAAEILAGITGFLLLLIGLFFTSFYAQLVRYYLVGQLGRALDKEGQIA